jgi:uncharacterized membrane protein YqaE (UPF0057 family)
MRDRQFHFHIPLLPRGVGAGDFTLDILLFTFSQARIFQSRFHAKLAKALRLCNFPLWGIEGADIFLFLIFTFLLFIPKRLIINYE